MANRTAASSDTVELPAFPTPVIGPECTAAVPRLKSLPARFVPNTAYFPPPRSREDRKRGGFARICRLLPLWRKVPADPRSANRSQGTDPWWLIFIRWYGRCLRLMEPEKAHGLAVRALKSGLAPRSPAVSDARLRCEIWGLPFANPLGLAAGFDKNAEVVDAMLGLGFGLVEVGTVTPRPQPGNPRPGCSGCRPTEPSSIAWASTTRAWKRSPVASPRGAGRRTPMLAPALSAPTWGPTATAPTRRTTAPPASASSRRWPITW